MDEKKNIYPETDRTSAVNVKRFEHIMCINTRIYIREERREKKTTTNQRHSYEYRTHVCAQ